MPDSVFAQPGAGVRFDWGSTGAAELSRACAVLVVGVPVVAACLRNADAVAAAT